MLAIRSFVHLSSTDKWLFVRAAGVLLLMRVSLLLFPLTRLRMLVARVGQRSAQAHSPDPSAVQHIAWAVTTTSRFIPGTTCLPQALAAQLLLNRHGYEARLCIGVARERAGQLEAHAWIESQGQVVIGGPEADLVRFTRLPLR